MSEQRQLLSTDGGDIEASLYHADAGDLTAVVLHPWATLGGCMDDAVVIAVCRALHATGAFRCVARFNMRGAGSTRYSGSPAGVSELQQVCRHVLQLPGQPAQPRLYVIGYSYGSCIAAHAMEIFPNEVAGYVGVGFPLGFWANLMLSSRSHWQSLAASTVPKLLITGTQDNFTSLDLFQEYADQLQQSGQALVDVQIMQGADHFFVDRWGELAALVRDWVLQQEGASPNR